MLIVEPAPSEIVKVCDASEADMLDASEPPLTEMPVGLAWLPVIVELTVLSFR